MNKWEKGQRADRLALCPCGSGIKYKSCCFADDREAAEGKRRKKRLAESERERLYIPHSDFSSILSLLFGRGFRGV
jgi:hypothetical protein